MHAFVNKLECFLYNFGMFSRTSLGVIRCHYKVFHVARFVVNKERIIIKMKINRKREEVFENRATEDPQS